MLGRATMGVGRYFLLAYLDLLGCRRQWLRTWDAISWRVVRRSIGDTML